MRLAVIVTLCALLAAAAARGDPPREVFVQPPHGLQKRLFDGAYDELEKIAADDLTTRARYVGGAWAIFDFYDILARYDITSGPCARKVGFSFDEKRSALES